MQPYNKNSATTGDYRGKKSVLDERVIEGLQHVNLETDLQLVYNSPKNIVVDTLTEGQKIVLPNATTLENGWLIYLINNDSVNNLTICLYAEGGSENPIFNEIEPLKMIQCLLIDNSTAEGVWKLVGTGEYGTQTEERYTTSVYDTVNISFREMGTGYEYSKELTTIPLDTPVKSIFIKPTQEFIGADVYMDIGTEADPDKFYSGVQLTGSITPSNYKKDLFEEILSTQANTDLIAKLYTQHSSGDAWTIESTGMSADIANSFYNDGLYAFIGANGKVATTDDLENFDNYTITDFSFNPKSVLLVNNYFYIAADKGGYFTIAKTADFSTFTYYTTSIAVTENPYGLVKCGSNFISLISEHTLYSNDLENASNWQLGELNTALTSFQNIATDETTCLIDCVDFYFTTTDGITLTQHDNSSHFYYDYLDDKWIRYHKGSLTDTKLEYSIDLTNWYEKDTQTYNIVDIQCLGDIWFVLTAVGQYVEEITFTRNFFNSITRETIGFSGDAITSITGTVNKVVLGAEGGNIAYSSSDTFLTLSSGNVKIIVEKVKEINPQVLKNPIVNTNIPIGTIFSYPFAEVPEGYFRLDGSIIENIEEISKPFLERLQTSKDAGATNLFINNEQHLQNGGDSQEGWGYFSWVDDDTKTSIRLPKISHFIQGLGSLEDLGQIARHIEAGLPNIVGKVTNMITKSIPSTDGALSVENTSIDTQNMTKVLNQPNVTLTINASNSNSIYGKSDTVQPEAYLYPYIISVYNAVQETAEVNLVSVSQLLERNNAILNQMYTLVAGIQAEKTSINRQCVTTADSWNFVRAMTNSLDIVCDSGVWATNAQGYLNGLPYDVILHTTSSLNLTLPASSDGVVYLEKNIITNEVSLGYTLNWVDSNSEPSTPVANMVWYDTLQEKLYEYVDNAWVIKYAVKIAYFTNTSTQASVTPLVFRNRARLYSQPDWNHGESRSYGVNYTADRNGIVKVEYAIYADIGYTYVNGQQFNWGGGQGSYAKVIYGSFTFEVSPGDVYSTGQGSTMYFYPCKGEVI